MSDIKLGKQLAYILRHNPTSVGLVLDEYGWVSLESLAVSLGVPESRILELCRMDDKQRFTVDGERIRAAQGHSIPIALIHTPAEIIPSHLFHGTVEIVVPLIFAEGLKSMSRQFVHLSADIPTAMTVAQRRKGDIRILQVDTQQAVELGVQFYLSENSVWLASSIPAEAISYA